ncbi:putative SKP1/BTB/POZ domain superfamily, NPH3 domain, NPH3/RPT2-like family protein [Helianthus debilis subsp. tardiflorus]
MKFMRIGTRPDNFYTQQAIRTTLSDLPSDLTICVNNVTYLLHKFPLLPKCGLLQRLCSDSSRCCVELHDIPGGEDAFELCAKFCYGVTIDLSAHNFVQAISAAKFLQMTESVDKGNFVSKLEAFFNSCILQGWKDSIVTLHTTGTLPEWSENLGIIRKCIDSIVDKIVTPPSKVKWSYTYTRKGYARKKAASPKDWWTEDIANLDIDLFRCIINSVKLSNMLPPQLIGEALHVYACLWLPRSSKLDPETSSTATVNKKKRQLETIISMIPEDKGSVSTGFLLRLLNLAKLLRVSTVMEAQLIKKCSLQLEDATPNDLLKLSSIDLVKAVVDSFMIRWTGPNDSVTKVGQVVDSYLQIVARDANMPLHKLVSLAKALPRPQHDNLYKAINIYLKEHPKTTKEEKKQLCSVIDCQKLSPGVCAHVVKNSRLPVRMVVQALFFEQDGKATATATHESEMQTQPSNRHRSNLQMGSGEESSGANNTRQKLQSESKHKSRRQKVVENGREILKDSRNTGTQASRSEHGHNIKDR